MTVDEKLTGGCACGKIRYEASGESLLAVNCHCRQCQYASGSAYASIIVVWKEALKIVSGEPAYYAPDEDDPHYLRRGFCPSCGSPVLMHRPERPRLAYILAGSLDNPGLYAPTMNVFTEEAHRWDVMDQTLDQFPGMPPVPDEFGR